MKRTIFALMATMTFGPLAMAEEYDAQQIVNWEDRSFVGETQYRLDEQQDMAVVAAKADNSASGLFFEKDFDVSKKPILQWQWRALPKQNSQERLKHGDDFAARVYVVAKTGPFPWQTIALNYIWSSQEAIGESWRNPFVPKNAQMVVLQTGNDGQWHQQRRDVVADFKRFFNKDIDEIKAIAIMTDSDNAGGVQQAWYGPISWSAR
ncbi:DUF3047 domain-containing protein [Microbulbifer discodermiae]|uniref:DUF3047 domain-containing protein n=1 Tax=Microbulbifer sp. 2201CG32-9 TaxID=3232309 RepID=UPI00345B57DD